VLGIGDIGLYTTVIMIIIIVHKYIGNNNYTISLPCLKNERGRGGTSGFKYEVRVWEVGRRA